MIVTHVIASSRGGGATYCRDLATGLEEQGQHQVVVMPEDGGHVSAHTFKETGVEFHAWKGGPGTLRARAKATDLLVCHGARAAFWARIACLGLGKTRPAIVYAIHGLMIPHYPPLKRVLLGLQEQVMKHQVDYFLAVCEAEKQAWCRIGLARDDQVHVLYYGLDVSSLEKDNGDRDDVRKELGLHDDDVVFLQAARFYWPRDFSTLLSAFDKVAENVPGAKLLLVGDGPWRGDVDRQRSHMNYADRVILTGHRNDTRSLFHASDIAVLSSAGGDGLPIANLEAMACGLPVVSANCDGMPEQIIHEQTGLLYEPGDVASLSRALLRLATDKDVRRAMGSQGRQRIMTTFDRKHMISNAKPLFESMLGNGS